MRQGHNAPSHNANEGCSLHAVVMMPQTWPPTGALLCLATPSSVRGRCNSQCKECDSAEQPGALLTCVSFWLLKGAYLARALALVQGPQEQIGRDPARLPQAALIRRCPALPHLLLCETAAELALRGWQRWRAPGHHPRHCPHSGLMRTVPAAHQQSWTRGSAPAGQPESCSQPASMWTTEVTFRRLPAIIWILAC